MPVFKTGAKPGPGRPKGQKNKNTVSALTAISMAAESLGGAKRLAAWAREASENERVFWGTIYPKLLPLQVTGKEGGVIVLTISREDLGL